MKRFIVFAVLSSISLISSAQQDISLYDGKEVSDYRKENFGFRKIELKEDRLILNGEAVRLPGIEDMPGSHPHVGMAESKEDIEEGCTMMDSLGILVQEEISWWAGPNVRTEVS